MSGKQEARKNKPPTKSTNGSTSQKREADARNNAATRQEAIKRELKDANEQNKAYNANNAKKPS